MKSTGFSLQNFERKSGLTAIRIASLCNMAE